MSEEEPNYNSVWDLHGNPINTAEPDKEPVCECDICGQDHAEIQHCAFKGLIDDLKNELAEANNIIVAMKQQLVEANRIPEQTQSRIAELTGNCKEAIRQRDELKEELDEARAKRGREDRGIIVK